MEVSIRGGGKSSKGYVSEMVVSVVMLNSGLHIRE
jgi:hypothetical protein